MALGLVAPSLRPLVGASPNLRAGPSNPAEPKLMGAGSADSPRGPRGLTGERGALLPRPGPDPRCRVQHRAMAIDAESLRSRAHRHSAFAVKWIPWAEETLYGI